MNTLSENTDRIYIAKAWCGCTISMMFTNDPKKPVKNVRIESQCDTHKKGQQ